MYMYAKLIWLTRLMTSERTKCINKGWSHTTQLEPWQCSLLKISPMDWIQPLHTQATRSDLDSDWELNISKILDWYVPYSMYVRIYFFGMRARARCRYSAVTRRYAGRNTNRGLSEFAPFFLPPNRRNWWFSPRRNCRSEKQRENICRLILLYQFL